MIVYLDLNKWIQLARVLNGKEKDDGVLGFKELGDHDRIVAPLSAVHYMEISRISNVGRRQRLGRVMWEISKGRTLLSDREIIIHEVEVELAKIYPQVQVGNIALIGKGVEHAFGMEHGMHFSGVIEELFERSLVTGENIFEQTPARFTDTSYRQRFQTHLKELRRIIENNLPAEKWENAIYAMRLVDIREPFCSVLWKYHIGADIIERLGMGKMRQMLDNMPTSRIDIHLHKQVVRNRQYAPKETDLEDWAGLGVAAAYCDMVVCEKHFRDLISRDKFETRAVVTNDLSTVAGLVDLR